MRPSVQLLSDGIHPTYSVAYGLATASIVSRTGLHIPTDGYEYTPKKGVAFSLTAQALVRRLVALVPPPRRHLTSFHGAQRQLHFLIDDNYTSRSVDLTSFTSS